MAAVLQPARLPNCLTAVRVTSVHISKDTWKHFQLCFSVATKPEFFSRPGVISIVFLSCRNGILLKETRGHFQRFSWRLFVTGGRTVSIHDRGKHNRRFRPNR